MKTEKVVPLKAQDEEPANETLSIAKPGGFDLNRFKSKRSGMAGVDPLPGVLPVHRASEAKDFIRLHPDDEAYWSPGLCFVSVPIKGQKHDTLHLIEEDLALEFLPEARTTIQHYGVEINGLWADAYLGNSISMRVTPKELYVRRRSVHAIWLEGVGEGSYGTGVHGNLVELQGAAAQLHPPQPQFALALLGAF